LWQALKLMLPEWVSVDGKKDFSTLLPGCGEVSEVVLVLVVVVLEPVAVRVGCADRLNLVELKIASRHLVDAEQNKNKFKRIVLLLRGCVLSIVTRSKTRQWQASRHN